MNTSELGSLPKFVRLAVIAKETGIGIKQLRKACNHPNPFKRLKHKRDGDGWYYTTREWVRQWIENY